MIEWIFFILSGLPNPCQNNGGCAVTQNVAQCYCQPAFTGYYCQFST